MRSTFLLQTSVCPPTSLLELLQSGALTLNAKMASNEGLRGLIEKKTEEVDVEIHAGRHWVGIVTSLIVTSLTW